MTQLSVSLEFLFLKFDKQYFAERKITIHAIVKALLIDPNCQSAHCHIANMHILPTHIPTHLHTALGAASRVISLVTRILY
jgi:hypothetical protein